MPRESPFQMIVGLDFGTAFTKVMVRNAVTDELYAISFLQEGRREFFLPSVLYIHEGAILHPLSLDSAKPSLTIPYLKMALAEKCRKAPDQWLRLANRANGGEMGFAVGDHIEALTGYFLLPVVQHVLHFIQTRWPDFRSHPEDRVFFQMSIPAEDLEQEKILESFKKCLFWAVEKATVGGYVNDLFAMQEAVDQQKPSDDCFFVAEVTANVMAYRRSRQGRPGLYLFVDVGAGTVDLSVFLYPKPEAYGEQQNYTAAHVSPTGSSHIEMAGWEAAQPTILAALRLRKEGQTTTTSYNLDLDGLLNKAKQQIALSLEDEIRGTLGAAQPRHVPKEFRQIKILVGGGGWSEKPYRQAVEKAVRAFGITPDIFLLPQPEKAETVWAEDATRLAPRFSVAHGLSYPFWDWPKEKYPSQMDKLTPVAPPQHPISPAHEDDGS
jgi:hypothetical protein